MSDRTFVLRIEIPLGEDVESVREHVDRALSAYLQHPMRDAVGQHGRARVEIEEGEWRAIIRYSVESLPGWVRRAA